MSMFEPYRPDERASSGSPLTIESRWAREEDLERVAELILERQGGDFAQIVSGLRDLLRCGRERIRIANLEGRIIAFGKCGYLEQPAHPPANCIPSGWYLTGLGVDPAYRRRGVATHLTRTRLEWLFRQTSEVFYFASAENRVSVRLHEKLGFREVARDIVVPGVSFSGGVGVLFSRSREGWTRE